MDYQKTQEEIERKRKQLLRRMVELGEQQTHLDQELGRIAQELVGLEQMRTGTEVAVGHREPPPPRVPGLKEHVRKVLSETQYPLTATEIRDSCESVGIRASSPRNLLMSVYTTLKRMHLEVRTVRSGRRQAYFPRPALRVAPNREQQ